MKIIFKLLLFITLLSILCMSLFYAASSGKLDRQMKHGLEYYLKLKGIDVSFSDFQFRDGLFTLGNVKLKIGTGRAVISNLQVQTGILELWSNTEFSTKILPAKLSVLDKNDQQILEAVLSGQVNSYLLVKNKNYGLVVKNIKIAGIKDINDKILETGHAHCQYNVLGEYKNVDCALNFGESTYLNVASLEEKTGKIKIAMSNIPFMLHKLAGKILPEDKLLGFFREFIIAGHIKEGEVLWNPAGKLQQDNLSGKVKIQKLDFNYTEGLPDIKNMDIDVEIKGSKLAFYINSAYSSDISLSDGVMEMDWQGFDHTFLTVKAKGAGPAKSLAGFISESQHLAIQRADVDLRKINGKVDVDVDIKIPLKPGTKNIYNITANMPNSSLNIFKDYVHLRKIKISGVFNGDQVILNGGGKINGFNSDINFIYNIEDESEFNHKLDIRTHFKAISRESNRNAKIAFISLLGGNSILDINYINKDSKGKISVESDISNLELYFDKLGIRKNKNDYAKVVVKGTFDNPKSGILDFSVVGAKDFSIKGDVVIADESVQASIKEIKYMETDLSVDVLLNKQLISASLQGKTLDLSDADMLQFLEKERDEGVTKIRLNVDRVRLKNNIWLDNLKLNFECDEMRCFSGSIESKIGTRSVKMLLTARGEEEEEWLIESSNAGAILLGIGAYDSMKSGNLVLNINTSRKEVKSGQIIPILDGAFAFERFVLSDTPTMSRLVSFVSLPGFIGTISGNKDIVFSRMNGKFSFANNTLVIKNSAAVGPYFDFNLKGNIDIKNRIIDIEGYVNPQLYGVSSVIGSIPLVGEIFKGNKNRRGLMSAPFQFKDSY